MPAAVGCCELKCESDNRVLSEEQAMISMRSTIFVLFFFVAGMSIAAEPLVEADAAFICRNYATALELYSQARDNVPKDQQEVWNRITAQIVRCHTALGETEQAVNEYFLLCRKETKLLPPLECIPLPWFVPIGTAVGTKLSETAAENRLDTLQTKSLYLAEKLLAAGTLSVASDNAKQQRGYQLLRDLKSTNAQESQEAKEIALLAAALLWKQQMLTLRNPSELTPYRRILDQIPEPLQAGPYFLFGQAAQRVGDYETAVLAWMRIPILYPENRPLAGEALRKAAESLDKLGRSVQAEQCRQEAEKR